MKILYLLFALIIITNTVQAGELSLPIEAKYRNKNAQLYSKFDEARKILDNWSGQDELLKKAYKLLKEILDIDDKYAPAHRELARWYMKAGYINSNNIAQEALTPSEKEIFKSIQIEPDYADSYFLLGNLYISMKRYGDARIALKKADAIGTDNPWLHLSWARLLSESGDREGAFNRYLAVINKGTDNKGALSAAFAGVIDHYIGIGDYIKADEWYRKELADLPEDAWVWGNYAGFLLYLRNDVDGAIMKSEKAISIMDYGLGRFTLACALYTKWASMIEHGGDKAVSQTIFNRAYDLEPDLDSVIEATGKYQYTRITAAKLREFRRKER